MALAVMGRADEARPHLEAAQRLGRDTPELHSGFGAVHFYQGRLAEASLPCS